MNDDEGPAADEMTPLERCMAEIERRSRACVQAWPWLSGGSRRGAHGELPEEGS